MFEDINPLTPMDYSKVLSNTVSGLGVGTGLKIRPSYGLNFLNSQDEENKGDWLKWLIGDKDFSPLSIGASLLDTGVNMYDAYKKNKLGAAQLEEYKATNRNAAANSFLTNAGNSLINLNMLAGWDPNAAASRAEDYKAVMQGAANSLANLGVDKNVYSGSLNQIDKYTNMLG